MADEIVILDGAIPAEVAKAMQALHPAEGFTPFNDIAGKWRRISSPRFRTNGTGAEDNSYTVKFRNVEGKVITLSGNTLLKSRVLNKPVAMPESTFIPGQPFYLKDQADAWWNESGFFADLVDVDSGYNIPMEINITGIIVNQDRETGAPLVAFNMYPGFMGWAIKTLQATKGDFPSLEEFREALSKPPGDSARDKNLSPVQTKCELPVSVDEKNLKIGQTSYRIMLGPLSIN